MKNMKLTIYVPEYAVYLIANGEDSLVWATFLV